jgi:hypothetical protein
MFGGHPAKAPWLSRFGPPSASGRFDCLLIILMLTIRRQEEGVNRYAISDR